jgi:cytochrome c oxidase subunit 2
MLNRFLPPAASAHAGAIDAMLEHVHLMVLVLFAGWAAYFVYVLLRFRSGTHPKANPAGTSGRFAMAVFAAVAVAEAVMLIGFALPLWFERTSAAPAVENPLVIRVTAEQFVWNVHYPGADGEFGDTKPALVSSTNPLGLDRESRYGKDDLVFLSEIHLPVNRPVLIQLASKDVIHSFGVPAMRVKQDAVPGLRAPVWFTPTVEGEFEIACSQLCGIGHHRMRGVIKVDSADAYRKFLADEDALQRVK